VDEARVAEVFQPGEILLDELNERGWTQIEFAEIIDRPYQLVNQIINGKKSITPETAKEFGAALGTSAELWMNLETSYQLWKTEPVSENISLRAKMRLQYPVKDMITRGWIESSENVQVIEKQLLDFFEISSLNDKPAYSFSMAAKRTNSDLEELTSIQIAWLYQVKHIAEKLSVPEYNEAGLRGTLSEIKKLLEGPEKLKELPPLLKKNGVRLVVVEPLPSSKIDGVCFWINDSPVIGLSLRFDRIDNFWFVLRHEIEHVLNSDGKELVILDSEIMELNENSEISQNELKANRESVNFCIPQEELEKFIIKNNPYFSRKNILSFAESLKVHPGILVGQLQWKINRYNLFRSLLVSIRTYIIPYVPTDGYRQSASV
jgi:HTH-type transcriptional regulator/antitoxin HigA